MATATMQARDIEQSRLELYTAVGEGYMAMLEGREISEAEMDRIIDEERQKRDRD